MAAVDSLASETMPNEGKPSGSRRKRKDKTRAQRFKAKQPRPDYKPIVKDNESMVAYYKQQFFLKDGEFDDFMQGLRETLPASFRINTFDSGQANFLKRLIQGPEFYQFLTVSSPNLSDGQLEKEEPSSTSHPNETEPSHKPPALEALDWYPNKLAWQMNITRLDLKRTPILQELHKFIMAETDNGFISRQEAVSMIPPLLLDVKHGQNILDMCAAPGSKTAQLLEYLKNDIMDPHRATKGPTKNLFDEGLIVANDVDNKRCYMLVHQSSRLNSPNCVITNQDAARLPDMKTFDQDESKQTSLKFDRILCDVPCSGDGTVRKNPDVWMKWSVGNANNFHGMQCKILRRGLELLKEDGLLVYSTCSMNPVEDEAVIASVLRLGEGTIQLEDVAQKLPSLKYRPGVSEWTVMNKNLEIIPNLHAVPSENATQIYPSLFPPTESESKAFQLHRCLRVLPHFQNTGGFFVAVLRKMTSQLPWPSLIKDLQHNPSIRPQDIDTKPNMQNPRKRRFTGFKEDPFYFIDENDPDWISIKEVYGFEDDFPVNQLIHRCTTGRKRSIYLVSKRTRAFIIANREEPGKRDFVKIINAGMRLFSRADTEAGFRICQDGVNEILPYIKSSIKVPIDKNDLVALLKARSVGIDLLSSAQHIRDEIKPGSFILIYRHEASEADGSMDVPIVAWKGEYTIALYVSKTYRVHLCALVQLKIGDEDVTKQQKESNDARQ